MVFRREICDFHSYKLRVWEPPLYKFERYILLCRGRGIYLGDSGFISRPRKFSTRYCKVFLSTSSLDAKAGDLTLK